MLIASGGAAPPLAVEGVGFTTLQPPPAPQLILLEDGNDLPTSPDEEAWVRAAVLLVQPDVLAMPARWYGSTSTRVIPSELTRAPSARTFSDRR
jgi:hypothetical protein